jgi:hypothetical protein
MPINYPKVVPQDVNGFALAWEIGGIKMILDSTSRRFAVDFANTVLKSYVDDLVAKAKAGQKLKQSVEPAAAPVVPASALAPAPSKIILTD